MQTIDLRSISASSNVKCKQFIIYNMQSFGHTITVQNSLWENKWKKHSVAGFVINSLTESKCEWGVVKSVMWLEHKKSTCWLKRIFDKLIRKDLFLFERWYSIFVSFCNKRMMEIKTVPVTTVTPVQWPPHLPFGFPTGHLHLQTLSEIRLEICHGGGDI